MCEFELPDVSLRCFVARQLLLRIYALSSVKFSGLKLWLCKKSDKYEVWPAFVKTAAMQARDNFILLQLRSSICKEDPLLAKTPLHWRSLQLLSFLLKETHRSLSGNKFISLHRKGYCHLVGGFQFKLSPIIKVR